MASVSFERVEKAYGTTKVIHGVGFDIHDGEFMVLVGPSGCGKSTLLRMLAGLEEIDGGAIAIDGKVVNDTESKDRDIAMVFQSYALYPHMTVADNMGFSLRLRKADPSLTKERVAHAARILNLGPYLERYPRELSGGQRQRVAMGRAIVRQPQVFLMDEPLSNLDAKLRVQTRTQIAKLQRDLGVTTVYVTHDQTEAMTMGDRVCVLKLGILQQVGTPRELYDHPKNAFVAGFIGSPAMNLLDLPVVEQGVQFGDSVQPIARDLVAQAGKRVTLGVRPEDLELAEHGIPVQVELVEVLGADAYVHGVLESDGSSLPIIARVDGRRPPLKGDHIHFQAKEGHVHLFNNESGERIGV